MLYLNPPFHFIDGVTLLPDHADPLQWYYLPMAPHLTMVPDPVSGSEMPSLQLLLLRAAVPIGGPPDDNAPPNSGFLSFDVNLGLSEEQLSSLRTKLQVQAQLREPARLAPVTVIDGSVHLLLLGKESELPGPPSTRPKPPDGSDRFVVKMAHAAKPSLYGDEQAAFSVELTQDGAVAMSKALEGAITPIGIVYSLDYVALRPAYTVKLKVHWDRVQTQLDENFGYSGIFLSVEIDTMVDKLIENRDIELEATLFVPEGPDAGTVITDFEKAKAEVREMITSAFFTPSIEPAHQTPDGWDKAAGAANRISQLAVTGGLSSLGSFSYKKTDYTRIDKKSLDVVMSERTAVRRSIWPQGHLAGLSSVLRDSGIPRERFITYIDLDDDFYRTRSLSVKPIGFTADARILSVTVNLTYGDDVHSVSFTGTATEPESVSWASVVDAAGDMVKDVQYEYTVNFEDLPGVTRPRTVTTPKMTTTSDVLEIFPPAQVPYWTTTVPISTTTSIPWDRWSAVDVDLRYEDPEHGVRATHNRMVLKENAGDPWAIFRLDEAKRTFQARLNYRGQADRQDLLVDWYDVDGEQVSIGNPYGRARRVEVVPAVRWDLVSSLYVDLSYEDPPNALSFQQSLAFTAGAGGTAPPSQTFATDIVDVTARRVEYSVLILYTNGSQLTVPRSATVGERLVVSEAMNGTRIVMVQAGPGDFAAVGLDSIVVALHYANATVAADISDEITLRPDERVDTFEFPFPNENEVAFTYSLKYRYTNGLTQPIDPVTTSDDRVIVPVK